MKRKAIWNPINPEMKYKEYEKQVGDAIEKLVNKPDFLISSYKHLINDFEHLKSLEEVHLKRRTTEKPRWKGASTYCHQIDVSFSTEDERVILLVECKHWKKSVNFPTFSAFLVRVVDIGTFHRNSIVLGMLVSTQGPQGKAGGKVEAQDCIARVTTQFSNMGYYVLSLLLTDF
jgi:hypothetical protein